MVTEKKIEKWSNRKKIEVHTIYKESSYENYRKRNSRKEIDKQYWICDYCNSAIIIKSKKEQQEGGEFTLPLTRLRTGTARVVTHQTCLNKLLKDLDEFYEKKR